MKLKIKIKIKSKLYQDLQILKTTEKQAEVPLRIAG
jgi:hypothetical protein